MSASEAESKAGESESLITEVTAGTIDTGTTAAGSVRFAFMPSEKTTKKLSCEVLSVNDSNDPSYTNLAVPYRVICRQRYQKAGTRQRLQFIKEIRKQEISQSKALSGVRIHREFLDPVLTPPRPAEIIKLTPKQEFKLLQLMNS